jgi:hypothetical protein
MTRGRLIALIGAAALVIILIIVTTVVSCSNCSGDSDTVAETNTDEDGDTETDETTPAPTDDEGGEDDETDEEPAPVHCDCYNRCRAGGGTSDTCNDQCCGYADSGDGDNGGEPNRGGGRTTKRTTGGEPNDSCLSQVKVGDRYLGRLPASLQVTKSGVRVTGRDAACYNTVVVYGPSDDDSDFSEPLAFLPLRQGRASIPSRLLSRGYDRLTLVNREGDEIEYWAHIALNSFDHDVSLVRDNGWAVAIPGRVQVASR